MSKKKNNWFADLTTGMTAKSILLNPAVLLIGATIATIAVSIHLWNQNHRMIQTEENFSLSTDMIRIDQPPKWVDPILHQSVVNEVAENGQSSLLDTGLVERAANKFQRLSWVENVEKIRKSKDGLDVKLTYRIPVGVVELNRGNVKNWNGIKEQLVPIDRQGIILPIESQEENPLPRITIFEPRRGERLESWSEWQDERIQDCALIAEFLKNRWQEFGFFRITTLRPPVKPSEQNIPYQLWTGNRQVATKVIWGNAPGKEVAGEASAVQKLQALESLVAEYGPLNSVSATTIDVRAGKAKLILEKVAEDNEFSETLIK